MGEFQRIRPFKILSVVMVTIAVVLTVVSLAGPDWVTASFYEGDVKSWGLWWDCLKVHTSFEMCLSADWLAGCAALVFLSLIADVIGAALGIWGLISKRRMPYIFAGTVCIISCVCMIVSLIIYPVMFTNEVWHIDQMIRMLPFFAAAVASYLSFITFVTVNYKRRLQRQFVWKQKFKTLKRSSQAVKRQVSIFSGGI